MPAIPSNKPYRVGRSRTGLGLFATKPIKKGAKIVRYFGPLLDSRKKKQEAIENKYLFELNGRWTIDGSVRENVARYINHACKANDRGEVRDFRRSGNQPGSGRPGFGLEQVSAPLSLCKEHETTRHSSL